MFVSTYYHCGVADHIRPNFYYFNLNDRNLMLPIKPRQQKIVMDLKMHLWPIDSDVLPTKEKFPHTFVLLVPRNQINVVW